MCDMSTPHLASSADATSASAPAAQSADPTPSPRPPPGWPTPPRPAHRARRSATSSAATTSTPPTRCSAATPRPASPPAPRSWAARSASPPRPCRRSSASTSPTSASCSPTWPTPTAPTSRRRGPAAAGRGRGRVRPQGRPRRRALDDAQVRAAVDYAVAALEVCGSRIAGWDISFGDTVADNASAGAYVLGTEKKTLEEFVPRDVEMSMTVDGEEVSTGNGAACLGDPVNALVWLARQARDLGEPLRAGQVILSGALGPMMPIDPGAQVQRPHHRPRLGLHDPRPCTRPDARRSSDETHRARRRSPSSAPATSAPT